MSHRWLALFSVIVGGFLVVIGGVGAWGVESARSARLEPMNPYGTAEYVEWAHAALPVFWLVAVEGIGLGAVAFVSAAGLWLRRKWALRMLLVGSFFLALLSIVIMVLAPDSWDLQIVFPGFCALLWWQLWQWRRKSVSAF